METFGTEDSIVFGGPNCNDPCICVCGCTHALSSTQKSDNNKPRNDNDYW